MRTIVLLAAFLLASPLCGCVSVAVARPPAKTSGKTAATGSQQLDRLFADLRRTGSEDDAKPIEQQIETQFLESGSATVDLLMSRGASALGDDDPKAATALFKSVTRVAPNYAEGWHQWAQIQMLNGDDEGAMLSLQKTITLNPRQFRALSELAGMLDDYGDKKGALATYRKVQALDPHFQNVERQIRALSREVEGQGI
jgi:Flp pilus assembly protein TadD